MRYRAVWKLAVVRVPILVDTNDELEELLDKNYEPYAVIHCPGDTNAYSPYNGPYVEHWLRKQNEVVE